MGKLENFLGFLVLPVILLAVGHVLLVALYVQLCPRQEALQQDFA